MYDDFDIIGAGNVFKIESTGQNFLRNLALLSKVRAKGKYIDAVNYMQNPQKAG